MKDKEEANMSTEKLEIDFYKELKLPKPVKCGLVNKIISPKGVRRLNQYNQYEYRLKDELIQIYDGEPAQLDPGLYWAMDIYDRDGLRWNHYLIIVEEDCFYPIAEFLNARDTAWIKQALPYIKAFFAGEEIDPIEITQYRTKKSKNGWNAKK